MLDLRVPIGTYFLLNGMVLIVAWLVGVSATSPLMTVAVNGWVGVPMILFGLVCLAFARRSRR